MVIAKVGRALVWRAASNEVRLQVHAPTAVSRRALVWPVVSH